MGLRRKTLREQMGLDAAQSDMERTPAGFDSAMEQSNQSIAAGFKSGQPVDEFNAQEEAKMASESATAGGTATNAATDTGKVAGGSLLASDPVVGGSILAGSMLVDNLMKANAQRKQMQMAHYQNQLSSISGGVNQYAAGSRAINQDMLAAMRGLS